MYEKWKGVHTRCAFNMIQELIPLTRPRTLAAALGPTILGAAFSYYAFGAAQGTGLAILHTVLIFLAVCTHYYWSLFICYYNLVLHPGRLLMYSN